MKTDSRVCSWSFWKIWILAYSLSVPTLSFQVILDDQISKAVDFRIMWSSSYITPSYRPYISSPELIEFPTEVPGESAYAYFYPPTNPLFDASQGEKPPLLLKSHGIVVTFSSIWYLNHTSVQVCITQILLETVELLNLSFYCALWTLLLWELIFICHYMWVLQTNWNFHMFYINGFGLRIAERFPSFFICFWVVSPTWTHVRTW